MAKTNWARVFLGGLLAGIIMSVLAIAATPLYLKNLWDPALEALGHPVSNPVAFQTFWIIFYLVSGVLAVWLYSAIRPRYGAGAKTAVTAGFAVWILSILCFATVTSSLGFGLFPANVLVIDAITNLVMYVIATLVGAWVYKEQSQ